eukprot:scaffold3171_cov178-Ochromonas_danica.AAC.3
MELILLYGSVSRTKTNNRYDSPAIRPPGQKFNPLRAGLIISPSNMLMSEEVGDLTRSPCNYTIKSNSKVQTSLSRNSYQGERASHPTDWIARRE